MKHVYIFDIDGTLANDRHRSHFLQFGPKNWDAYFSRLKYDSPIVPVGQICRDLIEHGSYRIFFLTGRSDLYRRGTLNWLQSHVHPSITEDQLYMRPKNDYRDDTVVKLEEYRKIEAILDQNETILGVFEDRKRVVEMWRENGIFVFDVSQGKGDF